MRIYLSYNMIGKRVREHMIRYIVFIEEYCRRKMGKIL